MDSPALIRCAFAHRSPTNLFRKVKNVRVGDMVEHRWSCHGSGNIQRDQQQGEETAEQRRMAEQFGLLVHDCFVDDGKSRRAQVVDGRG